MSDSTFHLAALDRLRLLLRPAGFGLASGAAAELSRNISAILYGDAVINSAWEDTLQKVRRLNGVVLGYPSDSGAGVFRGAALAPIAIREAYLTQFQHYPKAVLDVGDVFCIPELGHDDLLSEAAKDNIRSRLYPGERVKLPVSPLSALEEGLSALAELNPESLVFLLGGDQSAALPLVKRLARVHGEALGVIHIDNSPDLQEQRHGIPHLNSTWAFHALKSLSPHRMVQIGIQNSARPKAFWTTELPIVQFWKEDLVENSRDCIAKVAQHFASVGVKAVYVSVDLRALVNEPGDPGEITAGFVVGLLRSLQSEFRVVGGDLCELIPTISPKGDFSSDRKSLTAAHLLNVLFETSL